MALKRFITDIEVSGVISGIQISEGGLPLSQKYSLSGQYITQGTGDQLYASSGYHYTAGSGLVSAGEFYHIQIGSGLYLLDNEVGFDTAFGDARYAASGASGATSFSGLTDVSGTWSNGYTPVFNGTYFVPTTYVSFSGISVNASGGTIYSGISRLSRCIF